MSTEHDTWAGPIVAWLSLAAVKALPMLEPITAWMVHTGLPLALGVTAVWWTVVKALRDTQAIKRERERAALARAERLAWEAALQGAPRSLWDRLLRRPMVTEPVPLDSMATTDPQAHHLGKEGPP